MKKAILLFCVALFFLLSGCAKKQQEPKIITEESSVKYKYGVYEISFSEELLYNHSVGNDWQIDCLCDGVSIYENNKWTVPLDTEKSIQVNVTVTEADNFPDVSSASFLVTLKDNFKISEILTVTENKGKYTNNTAQWKVACNVKLIEKK